MPDLTTVENGDLGTYTVLTDEVTDPSLGTGQKQVVAIADGTVGGTNKLVVGADGAAKVDASGAAVPVTDNGATLSVDDGGASLTVDGAVAISGAVAVNDGGGTLTVDGPLTDTQLRASAVPVSDNGGSLTVDGPLTDTQLRATAVPVSDGGGSLSVDGTVGVVSADGALATVGAQSDAEATGNGSVIALLKRLRTLLSDDGAYYVAGTALTVKRAFVNVAASQTDSSVIAAVASKKLRILAAVAVAGGTATNLTFNSKGAGAGTAISPLLANGVNGGEILPPNPYGWFETNSGEALTVTTGAGASTGILVVYVEV